MTVTYEIGTDRVAHVHMDDGKANALNGESCTALTDAIARAGDDGAGALVIWGRDGVFSGGIDLAVLRDDDANRRFATLTQIAHTLLGVWMAPIPTVAAVTGHAIAGGAILAMACDRGVGVTGVMKLGANETALGMVFPTWAKAIIESAIPTAYRTDVMLMGQLFDPEEAVKMGIITAAVAPDSLTTAIDEVTAKLVDLPTRAYAMNKRKLRAASADAAAALVGAEMGMGFGRQESPS